MPNILFEHFPCIQFPVGQFRAIIVGSHAEEITPGIVTIYLDLLLIDPLSKLVYIYCDTIVNHLGNPRSREFFDFLTTSNVKWEQYEDLIGLTFDAEVTYEQHGENVLPILCNRKILASLPAIKE